MESSRKTRHGTFENQPGSLWKMLEDSMGQLIYTGVVRVLLLLFCLFVELE